MSRAASPTSPSGILGLQLKNERLRLHDAQRLGYHPQAALPNTQRNDLASRIRALRITVQLADTKGALVDGWTLQD